MMLGDIWGQGIHFQVPEPKIFDSSVLLNHIIAREFLLFIKIYYFV